MENDQVQISSRHRIDKQRLDDLDTLIATLSPMIAADGGHLSLEAADVETGEVVLILSGACSACAISGTSTTEALQRILPSRLSWVTRVEVVTIEAADDYLLGTGGFVPKTSPPRDSG